MANIRERTTSTGHTRYVVQFRHNGKQRTETLTKKRDAEKLRDLINALGPDEALARAHGATPGAVDNMPTVAEWLTRHIDDLTGVSDRTRADYRALADRQIAPTLGPIDVDMVTPTDISKWAIGLEQTGPHDYRAGSDGKACTSCGLGAGARVHRADYRISPKTIANLRALLSAAFGYAVDEGLRTDNPMRRLRRSRAGEHERADMVCLTPQEFGHLRSSTLR